MGQLKQYTDNLFRYCISRKLFSKLSDPWPRSNEILLPSLQKTIFPSFSTNYFPHGSPDPPINPAPHNPSSHSDKSAITAARHTGLASAMAALGLLLLLLTTTPPATRTHQQQRGTVKLAVIAPADPHHEQSLPRVLPAVHMAVKFVSSPRGPLPGWNIEVDYRDSRCSSTYGPLAAFDFHFNRTAGCALIDIYVVTLLILSLGVLSWNRGEDQVRVRGQFFHSTGSFPGEFQLAGRLINILARNNVY